ncbi:fibrinogen-like protein 1 [Mytilus californianus]|uniref:fibrinogen-like protein 1 n=1 Tax=Mytilus californianus TaxID=6549 RepID=UPI00224622A7|nr:fibrinogen-like protein 1 [Mytilus californianus]
MEMGGMFLNILCYGAVVINPICYGISEIKNKKKFTIEAGKRIVSSHSTITTRTDSSVACTSLCTSDKDCVTASYDNFTKQCILDSDCTPSTEKWQNAVLIRISGRPTDCSEIPNGSISGVYKIFANNNCVSVYCDMKGDGWTVIQRRQDGLTEFYRDWSDYKNGFGSLTGEHWLGNDNIFNIVNGKSYKLRFDIKNKSGEWRYAQYEIFKIADESEEYKLTLAGYSGNAGDAMLNNKDQRLNLTGQRFSTRDRDNDILPDGQCTSSRRGGWWFKWCSFCNPNGIYFPETVYGTVGIYWYTWTNSFDGMQSVTMKVKR